MRELLRGMQAFTPTAMLVGTLCVIGVSSGEADDRAYLNATYATRSASSTVRVPAVEHDHDHEDEEAGHEHDLEGGDDDEHDHDHEHEGADD
ncbi:MAG: hypothetical protein M3Y83_19000, partial [Actinomycetota bacterium]|nr:hypothetical protein [Actinomycetota bacterium]